MLQTNKICDFYATKVTGAAAYILPVFIFKTSEIDEILIKAPAQLYYSKTWLKRTCSKADTWLRWTNI